MLTSTKKTSEFVGAVGLDGVLMKIRRFGVKKYIRLHLEISNSSNITDRKEVEPVRPVTVTVSTWIKKSSALNQSVTAAIHLYTDLFIDLLLNCFALSFLNINI